MAEPISRQEMWHFIENSALVEVMVCVKHGSSDMAVCRLCDIYGVWSW